MPGSIYTFTGSPLRYNLHAFTQVQQLPRPGHLPLHSPSDDAPWLVAQTRGLRLSDAADFRYGIEVAGGFHGVISSSKVISKPAGDLLAYNHGPVLQAKNWLLNMVKNA